MGIQSYLSSLKNKVLRTFRGESNEDKSPLPPPRPQNLGEEIRVMVNSTHFESAYHTAAPFLFASLGAWPGYWIFRGMDYHSHRSHIPLAIYIRQTYYQAKAVQLFILLSGTYTVFRNSKKLMTENVENPQGKDL